MDTRTGELSAKEIRAAKNCPPYYYEEEWVLNTHTGKEEPTYELRSNPVRAKLVGAKHAPNKNEAKALRRICSQTGLTPNQVREHKKYRHELAQAAGPEFRRFHDEHTRRAKMDPCYGMSPEDAERTRFAISLHMTVKHKHFERLWAEERKRREEQAILDKLSAPW